MSKNNTSDACHCYDVVLRRVCDCLWAIKSDREPHLLHARNTAQWVDTLIKQHNAEILKQSKADAKSDAKASENNEVLITEGQRMVVNVAAYANDLHYAGRSFGLNVERNAFKSYRSYCVECNKKSAAFFKKIMINIEESDFIASFLEKVTLLITYHEDGVLKNDHNYDGKTFDNLALLNKILCSADALSYFEVLSGFDAHACQGVKEDILKRFEYEYRRIAQEHKLYMLYFSYSSNDVLSHSMKDLIEKYRETIDESVEKSSHMLEQRMMLSGNACFS